MPKPQQPAPPLEVPVVGDGTWSLADQHPDRFTLIVFYRGLHCPICRGYLKQLEKLLDPLAAVGVTSVIAVSGDDEERATRTVETWGLIRLPVGYGQSVASMRAWGLFVSKGIKEGEPGEFGEPGLFLVRPDGTLYAAMLNSMPIGRPHLDELVGGLSWINENDYPARGEA
ncbi:MAG: peroxiredoxin-like family protein [Actinomycetota bacterium]|jgi:peroxiredoxin|nr:peroxiredoxin-like family protein [Actinomycetota bacterium]MDA8341756.1 peroxiredoxin-like family protein [Actinomycetota bacterium]